MPTELEILYSLHKRKVIKVDLLLTDYCKVQSHFIDLQLFGHHMNFPEIGIVAN